MRVAYILHLVIHDIIGLNILGEEHKL